MLRSAAMPGKPSLENDADRPPIWNFYTNTATLSLSLLGYCLMSNHVHLIVVPRAAPVTGANSQAYPRALRRLLECASVPPVDMYGKDDFIPAHSTTPSLERVTLCGVKSSARRHGGNCLAMEMVERRRSLRCRLRAARPGVVAESDGRSRSGPNILPQENHRRN